MEDVGIGTDRPERSLDIQRPDPAVRLGYSDVEGLRETTSTRFGSVRTVPDYRTGASSSLLVLDRFGDTADDLMFQLTPAGAQPSTRWSMVEAWIGAGLSLGTGGAANPDQPIVFGVGRAEVARFAGGNLGTGTQAPAERLTVAGCVLADDVIVRPRRWSRGLSEDGSHRLSLRDVEAYVFAHDRLPEMPSSARVASDGLVLGEGVAALVETAERLTLHPIELSKRVERLEQENARLRAAPRADWP